VERDIPFILLDSSSISDSSENHTEETEVLPSTDADKSPELAQVATTTPHGGNRGIWILRGSGRGGRSCPLLTQQDSGRTNILTEHDNLLLKENVLSDEVKTKDNWEKSKEKIEKISQQAIRNQHIERNMEEKRQLVETLRTSEAEKKELANTSLFMQAMTLAIMGKALKALDSDDKDDNIVSVTEFQELKDDVKRVHENLSEIKTMLTSLINKSKRNI
jgi:hypothetical protein